MSRWTAALFLCLLLGPLSAAGPLAALGPRAALGRTTTTFVKVENGLFDDPKLAGFRTYAMRVTADTDWTNADLRIRLTSGTLNHVAPAFLRSPNSVNGYGDTAGMAPTKVLGNIARGFQGVVGFAGAHTESATEFQSSWFTTETNDIGTFQIAMITLSEDANGTIDWRTISGSQVERGGFGGPAPAGNAWCIRNGAIVRLPKLTTAAKQPPHRIAPAATRRIRK